MAPELKDKKNDRLDDDLNPANKPSVDAGIDRAEAYANDPSNSTKNESDEQKSIAEQEANATEDGGLYTGTSDKENDLKNKPAAQESKTTRRLFGNKGSSKRKWVFSGILLSLAISIFGAAFFLPAILMKTLTEKLTDTFLGRAKYAVEQRAELYVERYVNDVIGGSMRSCGTTVSRNCAAVAPGGNSLFSTLHANWRDNRIETKLFNKYGIDFELDVNDPNRIKVFKVDSLGNRNELGDFGRREVAKEVIDAVDTETKREGVLTRRHIRSVLANKYGAKRFCIIACAQRDNIDDARITGLKKLKLKVVARVAEVTSARATAYILCFATGCSQAEIDRNDAQITQRILSQTDNELFEKLTREFTEYGARDFTDLIVKKTLANVLARIGVQGGTQAAVSAVPIAGWIYLGATATELTTRLVESIQNDEISKYIRQLNKQESALYATQFINMQEDTQSFQAPVQDSLAVFEFLNNAGESRLLQEINGVEQKSTIVCDDGVILNDPSDPLVCPEMKVQSQVPIEEFFDNPTVDTITDIAFGSYTGCFGVPLLPGQLCPDQATPRFWIKGSLDIINGTVGAVAGAIISGLTRLPLIGNVIDGLTNWASTQAAEFFGWVSEKLINTVIDFEAEDQKAFDQWAMGLDVTAEGFAKGDYEVENSSSIEGTLLTPSAQRELDYAIAEKRAIENSNLSVIERYFSFNNPYSLISTATLHTATNLPSSKPINIAGSLNPFGTIETIANSIGGGNEAYALTATDRAALFDVAQYAYAVDDPNLAVNPDTLTDEVCAQYDELRRNSGFLNERTGEMEYTVSNPCALDRVTVDSLTKIYNLDAFSGVGAPTSTGSVGIPTGLIKGTPLEGQNTDNIPCPSSPTVSDLGIEPEAYINGTRYTIRLCNVHGVRINSIIAKQYDDMFTAMKAAGYTINGSNGFRDMASQQAGWNGGAGRGVYAEPGYSNHQFGAAVDISCQGGAGLDYQAGTGRGRDAFLSEVGNYPCLEWVASNSQNYGILLMCIGEGSNGLAIRESGSGGGCEWWHMSPTGG